MRLYAKIFLCATLVLSIALLLSGYLLITYSYESAIMHSASTSQNQYEADIEFISQQRDRMISVFARIYAITLVICMIVILALSAFITRPINKLNAAALVIAKGNYNERLPVTSGDELGELSESFNQMAEAIEEKIKEITMEAQRKEDFVANFAHELKTPMTSVIGYADMLYQKTLSPKQVKDAAWYILSEGMRLEALSLKLLDLIVLGRQNFTLEETRADTLFADITDGLRPLLKEKNVSLTLSAQPAYVMVEFDLFKTLLINLIDNATKAECTNIKINGAMKGKRYAVSVTDNGRGIPDKEMERIGEAFYMVDKSRSRKQHGAGLGISLANKIAEIHETTLSFESAEGFGTIVTFELEAMKR